MDTIKKCLDLLNIFDHFSNHNKSHPIFFNFGFPQKERAPDTPEAAGERIPREAPGHTAA